MNDGDVGGQASQLLSESRRATNMTGSGRQDARRDRHLLFLSHCVPNPPQKGEKIRAFHLLSQLVEKYSVHLVCFAKRRSEIEDARQLEACCSSVYVEPLPRKLALAGAAVKFAVGGCLTTSFYGSKTIRRHVESLRKFPVFATVAYTSAMAQYAPEDIPMILDMVDVDSEKWLEYASARWPGWAYRVESKRLRRLESQYARRATCTFFSTVPEKDLFQEFAPGPRALCMENGVDFDYFNPLLSPPTADLGGRNFVVFVGEMDYYPNVDAARWFANGIFAEVRKRQPNLEFFVVGRNPVAAVRRLAELDGVTVTGAVPDIRPYVTSARTAVAPLRIARGIQNKVLEALALGKPVLVSSAVSKTFGSDLPAGVIPCSSEQEFIDTLENIGSRSCEPDARIRNEARNRFTWDTNCQALLLEVENLIASTVG
jgi:sugar transferase (PEP-CTERM/EpsH1 system associated)